MYGCPSRCGQPLSGYWGFEYNSIAASKSKVACGEINPDDGLRYLTLVTPFTNSINEYIADYGGAGGYYSDVGSSSGSDTTTYTQNPCAWSTIYAGTSTRTQTVFIPDYDPEDYNWSWQCNATRNSTTGAWTGTYTTTENGVVIDSGAVYTSCLEHSWGSTVYSNPYVEETTAALIARTVAALPAYPDPRNESYTWSSRNLYPGELSYNLRRIKWRIVHSPNATCYLKVWFQRHFFPETGAEVITPLTPYEWIGSGTPCLIDVSKPFYYSENYIRSAFTEEMEPSTDGYVAIEIVKYSFVAGYVPPDDGTANGFPVPA